mgnify:FL=1
MPKYKFVINPVPLKRNHKLFLKKLRERLLKNKIVFSYEYTTKEKSAKVISNNAASKGYDIIVACGGDGTVMEVINGIYGTKAKLGVLPLGTSNDFAKELNLLDLNKALHSLLNGKEKPIDLGLVEFKSGNKPRKMLFCSTSGIGFDAKLLKLNNFKCFIGIKKIFGNIVYPLFSFFLLFCYKSSEVEINFSRKKIKSNLLMMNANFVKSMSGIKVTPNACTYKGVFDIIIFEDASIFKKVFGFIWYAITSKKLDFKEIDYISRNGLGYNKHGLKDIKTFYIKSKKPVDVQLNGDFVGYTPARFKIIPKAVELMV